jgi:hypothetical protein
MYLHLMKGKNQENKLIGMGFIFYLFFILWYFLTKPVYQRTVDGVPQFEKPCIRIFCENTRIEWKNVPSEYYTNILLF